MTTLECEIGTNKNDPQYVLLRFVGCPGGNECAHRPQRCVVRYDTYVWESLATPTVLLDVSDPDSVVWLTSYWDEAAEMNTELADTYKPFDDGMAGYFRGVASAYTDSARSVRRVLAPPMETCSLCEGTFLGTSKNWIEHDCAY